MGIVKAIKPATALIENKAPAARVPPNIKNVIRILNIVLN